MSRAVSRTARAALLALLLSACASATAHEGETHGTPGTPGTPDAPFAWVGPGFSGAWFDPNRSGEGVILEILPNGTALAVWFTYPPAGAPGEQAWMIAQDGVIDGNTIRFTSVF